MNIRILKDILANEGFPIAPKQCSTDRFRSFRHWKKMGSRQAWIEWQYWYIHSGIPGYLMYTQVFPSISGIISFFTGMSLISVESCTWNTLYRWTQFFRLHEILGEPKMPTFPVTRWFLKMNRSRTKINGYTLGTASELHHSCHGCETK